MSASAAGVSSSGEVAFAADEHSGRTFPCDRCGADLEFHIGAQTLRCSYCGFTKAIVTGDAEAVVEQDVEAALERLVAQRKARAHASALPETRELSCHACGATVVFEGTLTSTACTYCGTPVQRSDVHEAADRIPVDGVLPFAVEAGAAHEGIRKWARSLWFAPGSFAKEGVAGRIEGSYLPYFSFDAMTSTSWVGQRGDHYTETVGTGKQRRTVVRTRWTRVSGWFQRFFDDVLVPAVERVPAWIVQRLEPWPLVSCVPFTAEVLAGKLAHTYDVELPRAFARARERIERALERDVRGRIGGNVQRIEHMRTAFSGLTYKHLLLPVWMVTYRYRDQGYRVFVNARTGEVHGERPYSAWKILFAVLVGLVVGGGAVVLFGQR